MNLCVKFQRNPDCGINLTDRATLHFDWNLYDSNLFRLHTNRYPWVIYCTPIAHVRNSTSVYFFDMQHG